MRKLPGWGVFLSSLPGNNESTPLRDCFESMMDKPLSEILREGSPYWDAVSIKVSDYLDHNPDCRECEYLNACAGGCRAAAEGGRGGTDFLAVDEKTCAYFRGGWPEKFSKAAAEAEFIPPLKEENHD